MQKNIRRGIALICAALMILGVLAGITATAFAEENILFRQDKLVVRFDQGIDPDEEWQTGLAELSFGEYTTRCEYYKRGETVSLAGTLFAAHDDNIVVKATMNLASVFAVKAKTEAVQGTAYYRIDEESMTGELFLAALEAPGELLYGPDEYYAIARISARPVTQDVDVNAPWEQYIVSQGRAKKTTAGMDATHFAPERTVTRAQALTLLWRQCGCPKTDRACPFLDVQDTAYYSDAVSWAAENGVTAGTSPTTFSPEKTCTRAELAVFAFRVEHLREGREPFHDTSWAVAFLGDEEDAIFEWSRDYDGSLKDRYYESAVHWAALEMPLYACGIDPTNVGPDEPCTRSLALLIAEGVGRGA